MRELTRQEAPAAGSIFIRPAEERDIPDIAAVEKECFSDAWSETSVKGTFSGRTGYVLVAEEKVLPDDPGAQGREEARSSESSALLAYLIASVFDGEGELLRIAAAPRARWQGTAQALISRMFSDHPDVRIWRLDVRTQNRAAVSLYEKNGFRIVTENRDVYTEPKDNGYLMVKELC